MSKNELKAIYELRSIIEAMYNNEMHDHNNPMQGDKRRELFEKGVRVANFLINRYPPLIKKDN